MSERYDAIRRRCELEDIQTCHIDALDCLDVAELRLRRKALTAEDVLIIYEIRAARTHIRQAWRLVTEKHPQGIHHGE